MDAVLVCRACLAMDVRLFRIDSILTSQYETVTSFEVAWSAGRPSYLCYECAGRCATHTAFRDKCLRSEALLTELLQRRGQITEDEIKYIDRSAHNLISSLHLDQTKSLDIVVREPVLKVETHEEVETHEGDETYEKFETYEKVEPQENFTLNEDLPTHDFSDDDVPLVDIKNEKPKRKNASVKRHIVKPRRAKSSKKPTEEEVKKRGAFKEDFATEILLTKEEQMGELRERAMTLNYLNSPYKCTKCYKGFVDDTAYRNHLLKHDVSSGDHVCDVCQMRYSSVRRLRAHAVSSHSRKYACRACRHVSHTANQAREHDKWHKGHVYKCGLCGQTFRKPTSHLTHMRKRHPTEFVCNLCGDSFVGRHGLMMHKMKTHKISHVDKKDASDAPRAPESYCRECDLQFTSVEACRRHTVTSAKHALHHSYGNGCRVCGERFESPAALAAHSKRHAKRAPRAGDARTDDLRPDFNITHLQCDQCSAKFVNRSKLLAHIRRVHLGVKYNKNIVCELCGKSCTSNATLKYHQRTHTGEKPFACAECPKRFSDRNQLRIHNRTHTDERPYSCALCHKTFRQKPALNRHLRVHTGAKPYECQYCGKTFSQSNSLKIHVHTVHLKLPPMYRSRCKPAPQIQILQEKPRELTLQRL